MALMITEDCICCNTCIGELTNTIGFIIQNRMNINSILTAQIGTHPLLTASPAGYPLLKAAGVVAKKKLGLISTKN